jgi:hypothetical protein
LAAASEEGEGYFVGGCWGFKVVRYIAEREVPSSPVQFVRLSPLVFLASKLTLDRRGNTDMIQVDPDLRLIA